MRSSNGFGGLNPISLGMVSSYLDIFGPPWFSLEDFIAMVVATDEALREVMASKRAEPEKVTFPPIDPKEADGRRIDATDSSR